MAYEIEYNGQVYEVDDSSLDKYYNPKTGQLEVDVLGKDIQSALQEQPEEKGMDSDTATAFDEANSLLRYTRGQLDQRGANTGGALRNLAMSVIPGSAEAEAALRATKQYIRNIDPAVSEEKKTDTTWSEEYDKYLENARESREGYAKAEPNKALALQIGGGLASALVPFGAASKIGAINKLGAAGRGAVASGTSGALFGFGNAQGGLENRLEKGLVGATFGAGAGALSPLVPLTLGGIRNTTSRLARGWGKELPQADVEKFILSDTLKPNIKSRSLASTLGYGSARGAQDIENASYQLLQMKEAMNGMIKPSAYTGKTSAGTTAKDLLKATQHPSMTAAKKEFGDFVESLPTIENPTRTLDSVLSKNETAVKILGENSDSFVKTMPRGEVSVLEPSEFEYWQKAQQILQSKLPKKYEPSRLTGAKKDIYDAIEEISKTREKLFPGTKKTNAEYASAIQDQRVLDKEVTNRLRVMSKQEEPMSLPGGLAPTAGYLFGPARQRGLSRELIKTGTTREASTPAGYRKGGEWVDSVIRSLLNMK